MRVVATTPTSGPTILASYCRYIASAKGVFTTTFYVYSTPLPCSYRRGGIGGYKIIDIWAVKLQTDYEDDIMKLFSGDVFAVGNMNVANWGCACVC